MIFPCLNKKHDEVCKPKTPNETTPAHTSKRKFRQHGPNVAPAKAFGPRFKPKGAGRGGEAALGWMVCVLQVKPQAAKSLQIKPRSPKHCQHVSNPNIQGFLHLRSCL